MPRIEQFAPPCACWVISYPDLPQDKVRSGYEVTCRDNAELTFHMSFTATYRDTFCSSTLMNIFSFSSSEIENKLVVTDRFSVGKLAKATGQLTAIDISD